MSGKASGGWSRRGPRWRECLAACAATAALGLAAAGAAGGLTPAVPNATRGLK